MPVAHWRIPDPTSLIPCHRAGLALRLSNFVHLLGFDSRTGHIYLLSLIYKSESFFAQTPLVLNRDRKSDLLKLVLL